MSKSIKRLKVRTKRELKIGKQKIKNLRKDYKEKYKPKIKNLQKRALKTSKRIDQDFNSIGSNIKGFRLNI